MNKSDENEQVEKVEYREKFPQPNRKVRRNSSRRKDINMRLKHNKSLLGDVHRHLSYLENQTITLTEQVEKYETSDNDLTEEQLTTQVTTLREAINSCNDNHSKVDGYRTKLEHKIKLLTEELGGIKQRKPKGCR